MALRSPQRAASFSSVTAALLCFILFSLSMADATAKESSASTVTVIEHIVLFKFNEGYTREQELGMYEGLWSFEKYFQSIMAMSLGRVLVPNADTVTHGLVMRFPSKVALDTYMDDWYRIKVSFDTIVPFFHGELTADYEAEVRNDVPDLHKEGKKFENGVEHVELFKFKEGASASQIEEFVMSVENFASNARTEIVQITSGMNYKPKQQYDFCVTIRLPPVEGVLEALAEDPAHVALMKKVRPILEDYLSVDFVVGESKKAILPDKGSAVKYESSPVEVARM